MYGLWVMLVSRGESETWSQVLIFFSAPDAAEGKKEEQEKKQLWKVSSAIQPCVPQALAPPLPTLRAQVHGLWRGQWQYLLLRNQKPQGDSWGEEQNTDTSEIPRGEGSHEGPGKGCGEQEPVGSIEPIAPGLGGGTPGPTMDKLLQLFFNWSMIALQCCVSFCCTMKWISCIYTYRPSHLDLSPTPSPSHPPKSPQSIELSSLCSVQVPTVYLFCTWQCIYIKPNLPIHPTLPFTTLCVHMAHSLVLHLYPCPGTRFICNIFSRLAIIKKSTNNKWRRKCGKKGKLLQCWWDHKVIQPLRRTAC